jgi:hypothetical protein
VNEDSGMFWTFGSLGITAIFILALAWPITVVLRARMLSSRENEYRELASRSTEAHEEAGRRLAAVEAQLTAARADLGKMYKLLSQVD